MATRIRRRRSKPHHTRWHKIAIPVVVVLGVLAAAGGIAAAWAINVYNEAPPLKDLKPVQKGRTSAIYSADGNLIGYIHSENVRQPISGEEIPQVLKNATVSIEDKNFWEHGALDYAGIVRAAWKDALAGSSRSRVPRRSPSSWSATSTSAIRKTRSSARSRKPTWRKSSSNSTAAGGSSTPT